MRKHIVLILNLVVILVFIGLLFLATIKINGECFGVLAFSLMPLAMLCCTYITDHYTPK